MTKFPNFKLSCMTFSIAHDEYMKKAAFNLHEVVSVFSFAENSMFLDPDLNEFTGWTGVSG
jgi:hypothetical protein